MPKRKRRVVEPTDELHYEPRWEQLERRCICEDQVEYERIRPLVLFGEPVPDEPESIQGVLFSCMEAL